MEERDEVRFYEMEYIDGREARIYENNEALHSAAYCEEGHHYDLVFSYMKTMTEMFTLFPDMRSILMIGGGGYSYPKYVISHYPNITMEVVDIDPMAFESAKQFFYLDELIKEFDLENNKRLLSITDDGRHYLEQTEKTYDAVINDAYHGTVPVVNLITLEACKRIHSLLHENGMYVINMPGYRRMKKSDYMFNVVTTLKEVFRHVLIIPAKDRFTGSYFSNYIVIASDVYDKLESAVSYTYENTQIITDACAEETERNYSIRPLHLL